MPHTRLFPILTSHVRHFTHQLHYYNRRQPLADSLKRVIDSSASDLWVISHPEIYSLLYSQYVFFLFFIFSLFELYWIRCTQGTTIMSVRFCYPERLEYEYVLWELTLTSWWVFPSRLVSQQLRLTTLFPSSLPRHFVSVSLLIFDRVVCWVIYRTKWPGSNLWQVMPLWIGVKRARCWRQRCNTETCGVMCYIISRFILCCVVTFKPRLTQLLVSCITAVL